ncbi:hypothetical protein [Tenacibaculum agarivorans]|uniref:hypothetical protein n=1 Tax=Tenacibaculum agarivorans TaxID=1908389 RepID=UPI000A676CCA|nr:hypothetical protein [Tenacibaculum agarivorans]
MKKITFTFIFFINLVCYCQSKNQYNSFTSSSNTLLLNYDDLGPQILAHNLIGFQWWQWNNHGSSDSNDKTEYDIRVIVFKNISTEIVKKKYPVDEKLKLDFRYISYNETITYLDKIINEYKGDFNTDRYDVVKRKIIHHFNPKK